MNNFVTLALLSYSRALRAVLQVPTLVREQ